MDSKTMSTNRSSTDTPSSFTPAHLTTQGQPRSTLLRLREQLAEQLADSAEQYRLTGWSYYQGRESAFKAALLALASLATVEEVIK